MNKDWADNVAEALMYEFATALRKARKEGYNAGYELGYDDARHEERQRNK